MELVELHVLQGDAVAVDQRHAVAGQRVGVRGDREHPAVAAGGEQDCLGPKRVELAVGDPVGHRARRPAAVAAIAALEEEVDHVVLVVELDAGLDAVLVERLEDHVARPVRGLSLIHISEPTRLGMISYAVFCLKKKKKKKRIKTKTLVIGKVVRK